MFSHGEYGCCLEDPIRCPTGRPKHEVGLPFDGRQTNGKVKECLLSCLISTNAPSRGDRQAILEQHAAHATEEDASKRPGHFLTGQRAVTSSDSPPARSGM